MMTLRRSEQDTRDGGKSVHKNRIIISLLMGINSNWIIWALCVGLIARRLTKMTCFIVIPSLTRLTINSMLYAQGLLPFCLLLNFEC